MGRAVRFAVVGAGMMGREHIANLKLSPEAEIVAIADPNEGSRLLSGALAGAGTQAFADVREMLKAVRLDAVIVASPNHTHHDVLSALFETDLHILCEKPLASRLDHAQRDAERAARHEGIFWVGMEYRFMPPAAEFVTAVHAGEVGRLVMLAMREHRFPFLTKVENWNRFARNTGGTMVEKCCHFFDLMRLIVQSEPVRVYCSGAMDVNHLEERYGGERPDILDNSYTTVDFANGVRALLDLSMFAEGSEHQEEIAAVGDRAKLEVKIPPGELIFSPRVPLGAPRQVTRRIVDVPEAAMQAGSHFGATYFQQRAFLAAILEGAPVQVTAEDGYKAVAMGWAAEISAREKRVVEMAELSGAAAFHRSAPASR